MPRAYGRRMTRPGGRVPPRDGTISLVTSRSASAQHLRDLAVLRRVRDRIDREYAQPLDVESLARGAHMSAGHLSRQFRLAFGESPYSYLMTRRIERAMALLRRGDLSVTEICFDVGCPSWAPSALASPSWSGCRPVPTGASSRVRWPGCRRAWRNRSPDRSGIEKRHRGVIRSMTAMDLTIYQTLLPHEDPGRVPDLLSRHARLRGPQRRQIRRVALDHGRAPDQPGTSIVLYPPAATPGITDDERRTIAEMTAKGPSPASTRLLKDLDGAFERLQVGEPRSIRTIRPTTSLRCAAPTTSKGNLTASRRCVTPADLGLACHPCRCCLDHSGTEGQPDRSGIEKRRPAEPDRSGIEKRHSPSHK